MKFPNATKGKCPKGGISATKVIAYVMRERDCYPMPDGQDETWIHVDLPSSVEFNGAGWISITKKTFAEYCGVALSQVSRWINAGLPVRPDGRLNAYRAEHWLRAYEKECDERKRGGWKDGASMMHLPYRDSQG